MARALKARKKGSGPVRSFGAKRVLGPLSLVCLGAALISLLESHVWVGAVAAELAFQLLILTVFTLAASLATRVVAAVVSSFVAAILFGGSLAPLYREVRPTPEYGPLLRVAHVHVAGDAVEPSALSTWLGASALDVGALTGMRSQDAQVLGKRHAGFRVHRRTSGGRTSLLLVRETREAALPSSDDVMLSAWLKVGRCNVRAVVVDLPSRLSYRDLKARAARIDTLAKTRSMARSVWLGHLGSRAEASDLSALRTQMELRDSRRGEGRLATYPAALGALGLPLDHVLVHGWMGVRARSVSEGLTEHTHLTSRATLELTEPRCRPVP